MQLEILLQNLLKDRIMNKETRHWLTGIILLVISAYNFSILFSLLQDGLFGVTSILYVIWALLSGLSGIYFFFEGLK